MKKPKPDEVESISSKFTIRRMTSDDLVEVMEIEASLFPDPWTEEFFSEEFEHHDAYVLESNQTSELAGYLCGWHVLDEFMITNIGIRKDLQCTGLGEYLLREVLTKKSDIGVIYCYLEVRESNQPAINLYKKLGFGIIGKRLNYYQHPEENALVMSFMLGNK
jgi:[ribosomal protein S18]-alanine N-acetyltransferase